MKLRQAVGEALRRRRLAQGRTLREVAQTLAAAETTPVPVPAIGFLPPRPRASAPPLPATTPAPMAPVLDLRAYASRRTA